MGLYTIQYDFMKYLLTIILLLCFVSIAVFSIFSMHAGMQDHGGGCIAAIIQGTGCPNQGSLADYLAFHLNAFKNFSTAPFMNSASSLLILFLLVIGIASGALRGNLAPPKFTYYQIRRSDSFSPPSQRGLLCWLALHENSPATS